MEAKFLELKQAKRSVRKYETEFSRHRRYASCGNEAAKIRRFICGFRLDIRSRLQVVVFSSLQELVERAVNIEEAIAKEEAALLLRNGGSNSRLIAGQSSNRRKVKVNLKG